MSKIHILESDNGWSYKVAVHFATPAGSNSVGYSWKECGIRAGLIGSTILEKGTAPSDLTQAEYNSIISGDTIEIVGYVNSGLDPTNAAIEALCDIMIAEWKEDSMRILKYFGHKIEGT